MDAKKIVKPFEVKTEDNEEIGNNEITKDTSRYVRMLPKAWKLSYMQSSGKFVDEYYENKGYVHRRYEEIKNLMTDDKP